MVILHIFSTPQILLSATAAIKFPHKNRRFILRHIKYSALDGMMLPVIGLELRAPRSHLEPAEPVDNQRHDMAVAVFQDHQYDQCSETVFRDDSLLRQLQWDMQVLNCFAAVAFSVSFDFSSITFSQFNSSAFVVMRVFHSHQLSQWNHTGDFNHSWLIRPLLRTVCTDCAWFVSPLLSC